MKALYHVHSENSVKDCALSIPGILQKAEEEGYEAAALTDSDSMTGIAEFVFEAPKHGIKPIPGVELSVLQDGRTARIILMAKDYEGYVGICRALTEANKTMRDGHPLLKESELETFFGSASAYHGHVAASSSDSKGILSFYARKGSAIDEGIEDVKREAAAIKKSMKDEEELLGKEETLKEEITELKAEKKDADTESQKNFARKEDMLRRMDPSSPEYAEASEKLAKEKAGRDAAAVRLKSLSSKITRKNKSLSDTKKELEKARNDEEEYTRLMSRLAVLKKEKEDGGDGFPELLEKAECIDKIFGHGNFYIELMFHGLGEEAEEMPMLLRAAKELKLPVLLSNDVHTLGNSKEEILKWNLVRAMKDNKWRRESDEDMFYGMKTEEELAENLAGLVQFDVLDVALQDMHALADSCSFSFKEGRHYPKYTDPSGKDAKTALEERARSGILKRYPDSWDADKEKRMMYELDVIDRLGYSDYTLIISDLIMEERKRSVKENGYYVGPGRGSGVGSMVNYLVGITNLDPIKYGLIFERYLNPERISPPDIDSDIAALMRPAFVKEITERYGGSSSLGVCSIVTKTRLAARDSIRTAARILSTRSYEATTGLYGTADRIAKTIPAKPGITLSDCEEELSAFTDGEEREIIEDAKLIENVMANYGTHAAGLIISDCGDVTEYAPLMNVGTENSPAWLIQYPKEEAEAIGLLKLDALGLSTLDVITETIRRITKDTGEIINPDDIPFEREVFDSVYASGNTIGVFQCGSYGIQRLWKQMKPDCIEDIIAGIALYRPGPMDFIPDFIENKRKKGKIKYIVPQLEPILRDTYGIIVYQEQVMRIVRDLAGYSMGRSDLVRRAMAKKHQDIMDEERKNFIYGNEKENIPGCIANGIPEEKASQIYDMMSDFAKYAFNKSHAAAYAVLSYQTAWLKYHYPLQFMTACINSGSRDDIPVFIRECKRLGFTVKPPDVNRSGTGFECMTDDDGTGVILFGLGNVKGVKSTAGTIVKNREGTPYRSFKDFLLRSGAESGTVKSLISAGAFDDFGRPRRAFAESFDGLHQLTRKYNQYEKRLIEKQQKLNGDLTAAERKRTETSVEGYEMKMRALMDQISDYPISSLSEYTQEEKLAKEKNVLSCYVSGHPLDRYGDGIRGTEPIALLEAGSDVSIAGFISDFRTFVSKKKKEKMASFTISDETGEIHVMCWNRMLAKYESLLYNDAVLKLSGSVKQDREDADALVFYMNHAEIPLSSEPQTLFGAEPEMTKEDFLKKNMSVLDPYIVPEGSRAKLLVTSGGISRIEDLGFCVDSRVSETDLVQICLQKKYREKEEKE